MEVTCGFEVIDDNNDPTNAGEKLFEWMISILLFFIIFKPTLNAFKIYRILSEKLGGNPPLYSNTGGTKINSMFWWTFYVSPAILLVITNTLWLFSANFFAIRLITYSPPPRVVEKNCEKKRTFTFSERQWRTQ